MVPLLLLLGGVLGWLVLTGRLTLRYKPKATRTAGPPIDAATRDSLELLGLDAGADRAAVITAHRRLIARTHPDSGGTEALARQINAARDHLLRTLPE